MRRRDLVTGAVLGGLVSTVEAEAAEPQASDQSVEKVAAAIAALGSQIREQQAFTDIAPLRELQKQYLRANSRLPDFVDVGMDVWFRVYDWHVRWQQPLNVGRDGQGRLTVLLLSTTIVMRPDQGAGFIGIPYDNR